MSSAYSSPFLVRINRPDPSREWGFRLYGGRDVGSPLILTHVVSGSLAARHGLEAGDRVVGIGGDASSAMTHMQAQQAVIRCGNELELAVIRGGGGFIDYTSEPIQMSTAPQQRSAPLGIGSRIGGGGGGGGGGAQMKTHSYLSPRSPRQPSYRTHTVVNIGGSGGSANNNSGVHRGAQSGAHQSYYALNPHQQPVQQSTYSSALPHQSVNTCRPLPGVSRAPPAVVAPHHNTNYLPQAAPVPYQSTPQHTLPVKAAAWKPTFNAVPTALSAVSPSVPKRAPPTVSAAPPPSTSFNRSPAAPGGGATGNKKPARRVQAGSAMLKTPGSGGTMKTPVCAVCRNVIRGPFMAALDYTFCPEHFTCAQCHCRLDECGFVEENGSLYCENDFAKYLAPRCEKCQGAVIGSVVTALGKTWHQHCFLCGQCSQPLSETTFRVGDDGLAYCEDDWKALFSSRCDKCGKSIEPIDRYIEAFQKVFHADCFRCAACQVSLDGKPFISRDGKAFCKAHARAAALY